MHAGRVQNAFDMEQTAADSPVYVRRIREDDVGEPGSL
jgi:hypothetical protein